MSVKSENFQLICRVPCMSSYMGVAASRFIAVDIVGRLPSLPSPAARSASSMV